MTRRIGSIILGGLNVTDGSMRLTVAGYDFVITMNKEEALQFDKFIHSIAIPQIKRKIRQLENALVPLDDPRTRRIKSDHPDIEELDIPEDELIQIDSPGKITDERTVDSLS